MDSRINAVEAHVGASDNKELVAAYSYSQAKGAYIGGTLEGAIVYVKSDEIKRFYEADISAEDILDGRFEAPYKAQALSKELSMVLDRTGAYQGIESTLSMRKAHGLTKANSRDLARSGRDLVNAGLSGSGGDEGLLPGWAAATSADGKTYYYNQESQETQWEKPVKSASAKAPPPPPTVPPRKPLPPRPTATMCSVLYGYQAAQPDELTIRVGDKIELLSKVDANWWNGRLNGKEGLFPATYVKEL